MKNDYHRFTPGEQAYDSFGVTVTMVSYSETAHAATVEYADGSQRWVAAESLCFVGVTA